MSQFFLTAPAEQDLEQIAAYLAEQSPGLARRYQQQFTVRFELLASFPLLSAIDSRLDGEIRMALVKPYQIFYLPQQSGVAILRIIHSARDLQTAFRER